MKTSSGTFKHITLIKHRFQKRLIITTSKKHFCASSDNATRKWITIPPKQLSILFYGSDDFSVASLKFLHRKFLDSNSSPLVAIKNLEVVTTKPNNPVGLFCQMNDLPLHSFKEYLVPQNHFDLGVVASFGRMIPSKVINACRYGMFNVHASLLPRWRGASPIQHAILAGDTITGVTIQKIAAKKFDVGDILAQKPMEIVHRISSLQLKQLMAPIGARLLWECIEDLDYCLANAKKQPEEGATYAPKLKESEGEVDWSLMDSYEIDRRFRAFSDTIDMFTYWIDGTILKLGDVLDPDLVDRLKIPTLVRASEHVPGMIFYHKKRHILCVASANGTWSAFRSLTLKGRRKMSALGFSNTFIRPLIKEYKAANQGQRAFLILGRPPSTSSQQQSTTTEHQQNSSTDPNVSRKTGLFSSEEIGQIAQQKNL